MDKLEKIKRLAETLEKSGLAVNPSEALRQAEEIVVTEESVKQSTTEKADDIPIVKNFKAPPINIGAENIDVEKDDVTVMELIKEAEAPGVEPVNPQEPEQPIIRGPEEPIKEVVTETEPENTINLDEESKEEE